MEEYLYFPAFIQYSQFHVNIKLPLRHISINLVSGGFVYNQYSVLPDKMLLFSYELVENETIWVIPNVIGIEMQKHQADNGRLLLCLLFYIEGNEYVITFRCNTGSSSIQCFTYLIRSDYIQVPVYVKSDDDV